TRPSTRLPPRFCCRRARSTGSRTLATSTPETCTARATRPCSQSASVTRTRRTRTAAPARRALPGSTICPRSAWWRSCRALRTRTWNPQFPMMRCPNS
ncbi:hypothetical protein LPJ66_010346, partial [Kickxella alabastrina]